MDNLPVPYRDNLPVPHEDNLPVLHSSDNLPVLYKGGLPVPHTPDYSHLPPPPDKPPVHRYYRDTAAPTPPGFDDMPNPPDPEQQLPLDDSPYIGEAEQPTLPLDEFVPEIEVEESVTMLNSLARASLNRISLPEDRVNIGEPGREAKNFVQRSRAMKHNRSADEISNNRHKQRPYLELYDFKDENGTNVMFDKRKQNEMLRNSDMPRARKKSIRKAGKYIRKLEEDSNERLKSMRKSAGLPKEAPQEPES